MTLVSRYLVWSLMGWTRALEKLLDATPRQVSEVIIWPKTYSTLVILLWAPEITLDMK